MARAPFTLTVTVPDAQGDLVPSVGAAVTIRRRADSVLATSYTAETGGTGSTNALATDAAGRVSAWLERGAYRATVSGGTPAVTSYDVNFDAAPGIDGGVDAAWLASTAVPIGVWLPYGGTTDPAGGAWLLCDGRAVSRTTYAALFGVIGTVYGAGDGSSTFNLPRPAGRAIVGAGTGGQNGAAGSGVNTGGTALTGRTHGSWFGAETHALTPAEGPIRNHAHTPGAITIADHAGGAEDVHLFASGYDASGGGQPPGIVFWGGQWVQGNGAGIKFVNANLSESITQGKSNRPTLSHSASAANTGNPTAESNGGAHANVQPSLATNFVIRAL